MNIRDRIKELRRVRAGDLRPHPKNWRTHPEEQQNALLGILAEVGYVDALMVRELPDGSLQIVDGHLRGETTPDAVVPVLVVDLDDKEADKVLATFDPLAAMAEPDEAQLEALLKGIETDSDALAALLDDLAKEAPAGIGAAVTESENTRWLDASYYSDVAANMKGTRLAAPVVSKPTQLLPSVGATALANQSRPHMSLGQLARQQVHVERPAQ